MSDAADGDRRDVRGPERRDARQCVQPAADRDESDRDRSAGREPAWPEASEFQDAAAEEPRASTAEEPSISRPDRAAEERLDAQQAVRRADERVRDRQGRQAAEAWAVLRDGAAPAAAAANSRARFPAPDVQAQLPKGTAGADRRALVRGAEDRPDRESVADPARLACRERSQRQAASEKTAAAQEEVVAVERSRSGAVLAWAAVGAARSVDVSACRRAAGAPVHGATTAAPERPSLLLQRQLAPGAQIPLRLPLPASRSPLPLRPVRPTARRSVRPSPVLLLGPRLLIHFRAPGPVHPDHRGGAA